MKKKTKVLFISYLFAPNNSIGAIRPTKIAGGLARNGYVVDVVTNGYTGDDTFFDEANVNKIYQMNSTPIVSSEVTKVNQKGKKRKRGKKIRQLSRYKAAVLSIKNGNHFVDYFKNLYDKELATNNYDVVITSYGPLSSLQCGLYVKKQDRHIKWICDYRDPVLALAPKLLIPYLSSLQTRACKNADIIVAVSNGYIERICGSKYKNKTVMIPNGYDPNDINNLTFDEVLLDNSRLHITYAGALYEGKRDLTPIFKALRELIDENKVDKNKVVFDYAGPSVGTVQEQAAKENALDLIKIHGSLPRNTCLNMQLHSHLLVLSTWNGNGEKGVFPGKFLEYMLMKKPIISLVDGELPNSEISEVMREGNLGIVYESVMKKQDYLRLKDYLKLQYDAYILNGDVVFTPNRTVVERYNYNNIIQQFERLVKDEGIK